MIRRLSRASACFLAVSWLSLVPARADPQPFEESKVSWAYGMVVDSVTVSGNRATKDYAILREMETQPGDVLDPDALRRDVRFLADMTPFSSVEVRADSLGLGRCALRIRVRERSEIFVKAVLPQLKYDFDRGLTYGLKWNDRNFRGRLEHATLSYSRNEEGDDMVGVGWWAPWIGWRHVSLGAGASYFNRGDVPEEVELLERFGVYGYFGFPLTESRIAFSQVYLRVGVDKSRAGGLQEDDTSVAASKELSVSPSVGYRFDNRDSPIRPTRGGVFGTSVRATYPFDDGRDVYYLFSGEWRYFVEIAENSVVALFTGADFQSGDFPSYSYSTLGGAGSLRGHAAGRFKGHHRWFHTVEWRYLVLPRMELSLPLVHHFDVGVELVTFIDSGIVWNGSDDFSLDRFHGTGGLGLRFYSPVQDVIRAEFGFDLHGHTRFHTATGIRF